MNTVWLLSFVLAASAILTGVFRRYALARQLIDVPNHRSSHTIATPRGGGVAIVLATLGGLMPLGLGGVLPTTALWALLGAGVGVALVGFLDDHGHVAARWRLFAHFAAATWALYWLKGPPTLSAFGFELGPWWLASPIAALYLVWMLNLYNFMDGIDGLAGLEALTVCGAGALLYLKTGHAGLAIVPLVVAAAAAGFLYWNFPPARIFMGDAGSGFLGIVLGLLSLQAGWVEPRLFWSWLILLGVFTVDASVTLLRRLIRGDKIYEAHRSHAYQYASRRFGAHRPVALAAGAINLFWLFPMSLLVAQGWLDGAIGLLLAYLPLMLLALMFDAGKAEMPTA